MKDIKRIGLLTSGGDAPGMNCAIRAVVRTASANDIEVIGIRRGYQGMINGDMRTLTSHDVGGLTDRGGTMLYTSRCPEFMTQEGREQALKNCRYYGIDAVVVIGGDGSFKGAQELSKMGMPVIGIPGTIDNDIGCTTYTIGFDTACNTAIEFIDMLRDTMKSHERCSVVEVMGRDAGHIALNVGVACGATAILIPERETDFNEDVVERIRIGRLKGRTYFNIIVAEGVGDVNEIGDRIAKETGMDTRVTVLGHVQRGGKPNARDRVIATSMGYHAVKALSEGRINRIISYDGNNCLDIDIDEALKMTKSIDDSIHSMLDAVIMG